MFEGQTVPPVVSLPSLREVLAVASRRKFLLLLALALPPAASLAVAYHMTPEFRADSKVLVRPGREYLPRTEIAEAGGEMGPSTTMLDTINTEIEILTSSDVIHDVLRKATVAKLYPDLARRAPAGSSIEDAAMRAFRADLGVAPVKLSNVIAISLRSHDREIARDTLALLLADLQQRHLEAFRSERSPLLEVQFRDMLARLSGLETERAAYMASAGIHAVAEQRSALIQQRAKDGQELLDTQLQQQTLAVQAASLGDEIARQPARVVIQNTTHESEVAQDNQRRHRDLEQQANALRTRYPEGSPMLAGVEAELGTEAQFAARTRSQSDVVDVGINPVLAPLTAQIVAARVALAPLADKVAALRGAVAADDANLARLSAAEVRLADFDRQIAQLDKASGMLHQRLEDALYLDDLDRAKVVSLKVIQQPVAPEKPVAPSRLLFLAAGAVVGVFAFGLVLLLDLTFGLRIIVADTVERALGLPVAAALPQIPSRQMHRIGVLAKRQPAVTFAEQR
jgi:uncharacterized protein involved in exopolysaccharide biosynthesis